MCGIESPLEWGIFYLYLSGLFFRSDASLRSVRMNFMGSWGNFNPLDSVLKLLSRRQRQKMQQIPDQSRDHGGAGNGQDPGPRDPVSHSPPDGRQPGGRTHPDDGSGNGVGR